MEVSLRYCDKHACFYGEFCIKCRENKPPYKRHKSEINPHNKKRLKELKDNGWYKDE